MCGICCVVHPKPAVTGCNIRLVEALAQDLPIFFDHVVTGIDYSEAGVAVHTAKQTFTGAELQCGADYQLAASQLTGGCSALLFTCYGGSG